MNKDIEGSFKISPDKVMGYIEGVYSIKKEEDKMWKKTAICVKFLLKYLFQLECLLWIIGIKH